MTHRVNPSKPGIFESKWEFAKCMGLALCVSAPVWLVLYLAFSL